MYHNRLSHVALAVLLVLFSHPALAATIIVDETTCTLVDAITAANTDTAVGGCAAGSGADTVELMTDVTLTAVDNDESGSNALPAVTSDITVEGAGFVIERDPTAPFFRFFAVLRSGTLTIHDVTMRNGGSVGGGAIFINYGSVLLNNTMLSGNLAIDGGGVALLSGTLSITNSTLSDNSALFRYGGGVYVFNGSLTVTNSTLSGNTAGVRGPSFRGPAFRGPTLTYRFRTL